MARLLNSLFRGVEILMVLLLAAMIFFVFLNVILRFLFDTGLVWSEEVARLAFIFLVYLGTIGAYRDNRHLGVEALIERVGPAAAKVLYAVVQLIVIWVMALLAMGSWDLAVQSLNDRWVATQFPRWAVSGIGVLTGVAIIIIALANLFRLVVQRESVERLMAITDHDAGDDLARITSTTVD